MGRHGFLRRPAPGRISPRRNPSRQSNPRPLADIMMQAGRLAAEYLVSRGVIPASAVPPPPPPQPHSRESSLPPAGRPERRSPPPARDRRGFTDYERPGWRERIPESSRLRGPGRDRDSPLGKRSGRRFDNADSEDEFRCRRGRRFDNADSEDELRCRRGRRFDSADSEDEFRCRRGRQDRFRDEMRPRSEAVRRRRWRDDEMPSDSGREYEFDDEARRRGSWGLRHGGDGDVRLRERERYHPVEMDRCSKGARRIGREANTRDSHVKRELRTSEYMNMQDESSWSSWGSKRTVAEAAKEEGSSEHSGRERASRRRHEHITIDSPDESSRTSLSFGSKGTVMMETVREEDTSMDSGSREETTREVTSSPLKLLQENGQSSLNNSKEPCSEDQQTVGEVTEEKDLEPVAYKTCDLNLIESLDMSETPRETNLKQLAGLDLWVGGNGGEDKVAPVTNSENGGSQVEDYVYDSSKTKSDDMYSSLRSEWSKMVARDGTPGVRDGLNLEIS